IYIDPAASPLAPVERVDVIVLPASLRVYLVTARTRSTSAATQIGILTGVDDIAGYRAGYATRGRSGFGVALLADWNSIGLGPVGNTTTPFGTSDLWVKFEYVPPGARVGASFQIASSSWHRTAGDGVDAWRQDRRERLLRLFVAEREDGLGYRLSTTLATSGISHDTTIAPRTVSSITLEASNTWRRANVTATARLGAAGFPQQFEARAGWSPVSFFTLAGTMRHSSYTGGRTGDRGYLTAGIALPLGFSARAVATSSRRITPASPRPSIPNSGASSRAASSRSTVRWPWNPGADGRWAAPIPRGSSAPWVARASSTRTSSCSSPASRSSGTSR